MPTTGGQLDYVQKELQSRNEGHTCEKSFVWFEAGESTFSQDP